MTNFQRVLRLCLRYRWTVAGTMLTALGVAIFWGANIGAVYPFVEVVFKGESLRQWVDGEIEKGHRTSTEQQQIIDQAKAQRRTAPADQFRILDRQIEVAQLRVDAEQRALVWLERARPWIHRYMPPTPYATLLLVVALVMVGTLIKSAFLVASSVLEERLQQLGTFDLRKKFYRRTLRMDVGSFTEQGTHELMSRFTYDMDQL
ncbi:MAG: hypothetical protein K8T25_20730, partial [Planctomycetia bacterium]|nr:hypothetical protein [Planctomycetia bacterium]